MDGVVNTLANSFPSLLVANAIVVDLERLLWWCDGEESCLGGAEVGGLSEGKCWLFGAGMVVWFALCGCLICRGVVEV